MPLPVAESWFLSKRLAPDVTLIWEPHVHVLEQANIFLVEGTERDLVIDSGMGVAPLLPFVDSLRTALDKPLVNVSTHTHIDHIGGVHEFAERLVHPLEADEMAVPSGLHSLFRDEIPESLLRLFEKSGYPPLWELLIDALPHDGYDPRSYRLNGARATGLLDEGDTVDLGDKRYSVIHLPGHSPGGIGLFEESTGVLFAGDAIYDGPLIYEGPGMSVADYMATFDKLRALPVSIVHGGHDPSFPRARMMEIIDDYSARFAG